MVRLGIARSLEKNKRQNRYRKTFVRKRLLIASAADIVIARQHARALASKAGFSTSGAMLIAVAITEISKNMIEHAGQGEILMQPIEYRGQQGIQILARDEGPGIADLDRALEYGCSTGKGLGLGLPGARWLMDEFEIDSRPGGGTTITMKKWVNENEDHFISRAE